MKDIQARGESSSPQERTSRVCVGSFKPICFKSQREKLKANRIYPPLFSLVNTF
jgi:hypothetical protein